VDVVVPAFNEEAHIERCLDHIFTQDYPGDRIVVWVVDAGSSDRTVDVVRARERDEPRLHLLTGHGRLNAGQAMNVGIAAGTAELVARVDAHTYIAPDYLRRAAEIFAELGPGLALVGGQPRQVGETRFGRAVSLARRSNFGVGGSVYADRRPRAFVDTVQGGVFRRAALEAVGGFAASVPAGEDEECNWRLRRAGYDIVLDNSLRFEYTTRSSWRTLFRQYRHYGSVRVRVVRMHPGYLRPRHVIPGGFVAVVAALAALSPVSSRARTMLTGALATYTAAVAGASLAATRDDDRSLTPSVAACFTALHVGYGVGLLGGIGSACAASLGWRTPSDTVAAR
jgi:glycosyltransferase involved in cell wall biosynthesis